MTKGKLGKEAQKALVSLFITIWSSLKDGERAFVTAAEALMRSDIKGDTT